MADQLLARFDVHVTFNPAGITDPAIPILSFSGSGIKLPEKEIVVKPGIGMIVFDLADADGSHNARFQTSPIQWLAPPPPGMPANIPVTTPDMFMIQRIGDWNLTVLDFNSAPPPDSITHFFNLVVVYEGKTYGSDPKIINEPPSG